MKYQEKLSPWTIIRMQPDPKGVTLARFRRRSEAEGHLLVLKKMMPQGEFTIVFESHRNAVG